MPTHEAQVSSNEVSPGALAGKLDPDQKAAYREYFVVQTADTLRRFREQVAPCSIPR